jgi:hypothetical protein
MRIELVRQELGQYPGSERFCWCFGAVRILILGDYEAEKRVGGDANIFVRQLKSEA